MRKTMERELEIVTPSVLQSYLGKIIALDMACLKALGSLTLPKFVSLPLVLLVRIGDGWIWFIIAFYLWKSLPLMQLQTAVFHGLLAIAISLAIYWPIKLLVRRIRPHESGIGVLPRVPPLDKFSFPSGHTMNNMAVALTISLYLPHLFLPALLLPIFLGLLRVLFGVHYLSDIYGGAILGILSYFLAKVIFPFLPL
jgi:undecaprenyl-diphosphatase